MYIEPSHRRGLARRLTRSRWPYASAWRRPALPSTPGRGRSLYEVLRVHGDDRDVIPRPDGSTAVVAQAWRSCRGARGVELLATWCRGRAALWRRGRGQRPAIAEHRPSRRAAGPDGRASPSHQLPTASMPRSRKGPDRRRPPVREMQRQVRQVVALPTTEAISGRQRESCVGGDSDGLVASNTTVATIPERPAAAPPGWSTASKIGSVLLQIAL